MSAATRTRPSYRAAVEWVALNDNPGDSEGPEEVSSYLTVVLIADMFGKNPGQVAMDVCRCREGGGA